MHSKYTFLFLGLLAMLAIGWLLSSQENAATEPGFVAANTAETAPMAAPALESEQNTSARVEVATPPPVAEPKLGAPMGLEEPEYGFVRGRIVDSYGRPILEGRVIASRKGKRMGAQALQGDDRIYRFRLEAPKIYELAVEPESLPQGYAPPMLKDRRGPGGGGPLQRPAFYSVAVKPEQEQTLDLVVGMAAEASGQVVDAMGTPVPGVFVQCVRLDSYGGEIDDQALTDSQGNFTFTDVFPGNYRLTVLVTPEQAPKGKLWNPPPPIDVLIQGGQPHHFGQLVVGAGIGQIEGRIVDQDGRGFPGLLVMAYSNEPVGEGLQEHDFNSMLAHARTDADGYYRLQGLELMAVKVSLTPNFEPGQARGPGHVAMWVPNLDVDLDRDGPSIDVGTTVVEESRPFQIRGSLLCDAAWLASGHHPNEVRVDIVQVKGEALPQGVRRNPVRARVRLDAETNTFRYAVETPMTPLIVRLSLRGFEPKEYLVTPVPLQEWNQQIRIPGDLEKSP